VAAAVDGDTNNSGVTSPVGQNTAAHSAGSGSRDASYRRWPMASPRLNAFWRIAPGVRFIAFEILTTGVLLFECALRSRTCSFVQATRLVRLAIKFILFERLSLNTSQRHDKHFKTRAVSPYNRQVGTGTPCPVP
jgi:hypothetical protein